MENTMTTALWPTDFKVKNRQIFYKGKMVENLENSWFTPTELPYSIAGFSVEGFEEYIKTHGHVNPNHILLGYNNQERKGERCPDVLAKWLKSYGIKNPTMPDWHAFVKDVETGKYPCNFVDADVTEMDDDEVMSFVRKHRRHNIPIWHDLRVQIYHINHDDNGYDECDKQHERRLAYRYAAGRIANMDDEDLMQMMEDY